MLTDEPIHASLATADIERARAWYRDKLGLDPNPRVEGVLVYRDAGALFTVFPSEFAGTARNTVMTRNMPDLRAEVARLRARGVVFEEYDMGEFGRTHDGIMAGSSGSELLAWFKDADGNVIGLAEVANDPMPLGWSPMIATSDVDRAKAWYHDKLGFNPAFESPGAITYTAADTAFTVYPTSLAGTARNTVAIWRLADARSEVDRLRSRGVVFDDYDFGENGKTVDGVLVDEDGSLLAWFRDPDGNVLGIVEDHGEPI